MSKSKRLLSLVLALLMALTLFGGVTAWADDEDTESVDEVDPFTGVTESSIYSEPIVILRAAGVTNGRESEAGDRYFDPNANITRAEVAALIARLALGASAAERLPVAASFDDVPADNFYSRYIAWGKSQGLLNGTNWEQTVFDPDGQVTGIAVVKMVLGALGYGAKDEFVGPMWETNAYALAFKIGLLRDLPDDVDLADSATRADMALVMYNALDIPGVRYVTQVEDYLWIGENWLTGDVAFENLRLFLEVNKLSRVQVEDPDFRDAGVQITPYGYLYYRWQMTVSGEALTEWKRDVRYEKEVKVTVTNPDMYEAFRPFATTYDGIQVGITGGDVPSPITRLFINGAMLAGNSRGGTGYGTGSPYTILNGFNGYTSVDVNGKVVFEPTVAQSWDIRDFLHQSGMEIVWLDRKQSPLGEYNIVTGSGIAYRPRRVDETDAFWYNTSEFDGRADKAVITFEHLGEVTHIDRTGLATVRVVYNDQWTRLVQGIYATREYNYGPNELSTATTSYAIPADTYKIGDKVRVTLRSSKAQITQDTDGDKINDDIDNFWFSPALTPDTFYLSLWGPLNTELADTVRTSIPTYYYWNVLTYVDNNNANLAAQTVSRVNGASVLNEKEWISGTYYKMLIGTILRNFTSTFTLYLDKNGQVLGGFNTVDQKQYGMIIGMYDYSDARGRTTIDVLTANGEVVRMENVYEYYFYNPNTGTFRTIKEMNKGDIVWMVAGNVVYIPTIDHPDFVGRTWHNAAWRSNITADTLLIDYSRRFWPSVANYASKTADFNGINWAFVSAAQRADLDYSNSTLNTSNPPTYTLYYHNGELVAVVPTDLFFTRVTGVLDNPIYIAPGSTSPTIPLSKANIVLRDPTTIPNGKELEGVGPEATLYIDAPLVFGIGSSIDLSNLEVVVTSNGVIDITKSGATDLEANLTDFNKPNITTWNAYIPTQKINWLLDQLSFETGAALRLTFEQLCSWFSSLTPAQVAAALGLSPTPAPGDEIEIVKTTVAPGFAIKTTSDRAELTSIKSEPVTTLVGGGDGSSVGNRILMAVELPNGSSSVLAEDLGASSLAVAQLMSGVDYATVVGSVSLNATGVTTIYVRVISQSGKVVKYYEVGVTVAQTPGPDTDKSAKPATDYDVAFLNTAGTIAQFELTSSHTETAGSWFVYFDSACTNPYLDVSVQLLGGTMLRLTDAATITPGTYYLVWWDGTKLKSDPLEFKVQDRPTATVTTPRTFYVGTSIAAASNITVEITLTDESFDPAVVGTDITNWFTGLNGLVAAATTLADTGGGTNNELTVRFTGTATASKAAAEWEVTVPANVLTVYAYDLAAAAAATDTLTIIGPSAAFAASASITGTTNVEMTAGSGRTFTIRLARAWWNVIGAGVDVSSWFTGLPAGVRVTVQTAITGTSTADLVVELVGTPTAVGTVTTVAGAGLTIDKIPASAYRPGELNTNANATGYEMLTVVDATNVLSIAINGTAMAALSGTVAAAVGATTASGVLTITLTNATFDSGIASGDLVSSWLTLPSGWTADVLDVTGDTVMRVTLTYSGAALTASTAAIPLVITGSALGIATDPIKSSTAVFAIS